MTEPDMSYMRHLEAVAVSGILVIEEKTRTYGDSWKARGGQGAWFTMVRPWDRLEKIVEGCSGDIFAAICDGPSGADGTALACVRDLRNYLTLIEAHMVATGVVDLRVRKSGELIGRLAQFRESFEARGPGPGTPEDGGHHAAAALEDAGDCSSAPAGSTVAAGRPHSSPEDLVAAVRRLLRDHGLTASNVTMGPSVTTSGQDLCVLNVRPHY